VSFAFPDLRGDIAIVDIIEGALSLVGNSIAGPFNIILIHDVFLWLVWINSGLRAFNVIDVYLVSNEFVWLWSTVLKGLQFVARLQRV